MATSKSGRMAQSTSLTRDAAAVRVRGFHRQRFDLDGSNRFPEALRATPIRSRGLVPITRSILVIRTAMAIRTWRLRPITARPGSIAMRVRASSKIASSHRRGGRWRPGSLRVSRDDDSGKLPGHRHFPGVWNFYIATTFDRGQTFHLVNATGNDPVQIGSICTREPPAGPTATCSILMTFKSTRKAACWRLMPMAV